MMTARTKKPTKIVINDPILPDQTKEDASDATDPESVEAELLEIEVAAIVVRERFEISDEASVISSKEYGDKFVFVFDNGHKYEVAK